MSNEVARNIHEVIKSVVGNTSKFLPLHEPTFHSKENEYVKDCIDTGWVSSVGSYVDDFERKLESFTGVKHAIAVTNGTAALHISLVVLGVKEGDEVLIPAFTFVATANAVKYCGATPHFVDSEKDSMGIDPLKLRNYLSSNTEIKNNECINKNTGKRIRAVVPMHTFGHPVNINELLEIAKDFKLKLVEDAAESLGSFSGGKHTGNYGDVACLSFNGNKIITTGGGGAVLTNNSELAKKLSHITKTSKIAHKWDFVHDEVGYNYRLPNLNAALGCAQMESLPNFLELKRSLASKYEKAFQNNKYVDFFKEPKNTKSNYWLNTIVLKDEYLSMRDHILEITNDNNIMTRPSWKLIPNLEPYSDCPKMDDLSLASYLEKAVINIPSSPYLGDKDA